MGYNFRNFCNDFDKHHGFLQQGMVPTCHGTCSWNLLGDLEHLFFHLLGMSSSQLISILFRGVAKNHLPVLVYYLEGPELSPWPVGVLQDDGHDASPAQLKVAAPSETFGRDRCEPTATGTLPCPVPPVHSFFASETEFDRVTGYYLFWVLEYYPSLITLRQVEFYIFDAGYHLIVRLLDMSHRLCSRSHCLSFSRRGTPKKSPTGLPSYRISTGNLTIAIENSNL